MKTFIKPIKRGIYVKFNDEFYMKQFGYDFRKMTEADKALKTAWKDESGWKEYDAESAVAGLQKYYEERKKYQSERAAENAKWNSDREKELNEKWAVLSKMDIIPSTIENIKTVLEILNRENWGCWILPKMEIAYAAHQYDCDGSLAATMTLAKKVDGNYKYKVGGKFGHLIRYISL